jgi:hypothetical protein
MDREGIDAFLRARRLAVIATVHDDGTPEAALIGYAMTPAGEFVFDCERHSRKSRNLEARPHAALVVGLEDETTVQIEGETWLPAGGALEEAKRHYLAVWPDGEERARSPDIVHWLLRPRWLRYSCFVPEVEIVELDLAEG